jgi:hypothetical protein
VHRVRIEDVVHVVRHVLEPDTLVTRTRALHQVTAHQPDPGTEATREELCMERSVQGVVLSGRDLKVGCVRLVLQRYPADVREPSRPDEIFEDRGESTHEQRRLQPRGGRCLVRDVDRCPRVLRELDRLDERGHVAWIGLLPDVVEDAHELRLERLYLRFEIGERRRRRRCDRGEDVLIELCPEAAEAVDE